MSANTVEFSNVKDRRDVKNASMLSNSAFYRWKKAVWGKELGKSEINHENGNFITQFPSQDISSHQGFPIFESVRAAWLWIISRVFVYSRCSFFKNTLIFLSQSEYRALSSFRKLLSFPTGSNKLWKRFAYTITKNTYLLNKRISKQ